MHMYVYVYLILLGAWGCFNLAQGATTFLFGLWLGWEAVNPVEKVISLLLALRDSLFIGKCSLPFKGLL